MNTAKATLSNFRQAPRKMRLVANLVRGKKVSDALTVLDFTVKKASNPIKNLISSALSNAKNLGMNTEDLMVKSIKVDSGKIMYRRRPASRGSAHPIRKRTSLITVELTQLVESKKAQVIKKVPKVEEKKPKVKEVAKSKAKK